MLMGVVANERPELFLGIVASVPFVDVLNTMLDDTLPLTRLEYHEWGNPNNPADYERIQSYSPYENVKRQNYPAMLVTAGLHDKRVLYWEAAKWVAKLRHMKTDKNLLLLRTEISAGHGGASGRYDALKELAEELCFIVMLLDQLPQN
jgi:oligopeptidase B